MSVPVVRSASHRHAHACRSPCRHRTGETIKLHKFPNAKNPLPVIPKLDEMKVCPLTGDTKFSTKRVGNYD